jgi:SpoU rRNA methylase family enzyme
MKRKWTKPELVVLFRVQSNEAVLGNCKTAYGIGPEQARTGCQNVGGTAACTGNDPRGS